MKNSERVQRFSIERSLEAYFQEGLPSCRQTKQAFARRLLKACREPAPAHDFRDDAYRAFLASSYCIDPNAGVAVVRQNRCKQQAGPSIRTQAPAGVRQNRSKQQAGTQTRYCGAALPAVS